jgi:hypothetical protein
MSIQEHPDDVRKNGILLNGVITRVSQTVKGRKGNDLGGYYVHARTLKKDVVFTVTISSYRYFSVGDNVKIWKYKDVFYLDEYNNMEPINVWPLFLAEAVCSALIIYLYLRRRRSHNQ